MNKNTARCTNVRHFHVFCSRSRTKMPLSPKRAQRKNSPFTKDQETWIILEYGSVKNVLTVKRRFRTKNKLHPYQVPRVAAFERLVERFFTTEGQVRPAVSAGRPPIAEELVQTVKDCLTPFTRRGSRSPYGVWQTLSISPSPPSGE